MNNSNVDRFVIKISGEAFDPGNDNCIDIEWLKCFSAEIAGLKEEISVVVGGGNIIRGASLWAQNISRVKADKMGMIATVINGLAFVDAFTETDVRARMFTAFEIESIGERFSVDAVNESFEKGEVPVFAGGTGNPFFTTDTAAALRSAEIGADLLIKATKVDGIYTSDPLEDKDAQRIEEISYMDVLKRDLEFMDKTAISLCRDNDIDVLVTSLEDPSSIRKVTEGEHIGSIVRRQKC